MVSKKELSEAQAIVAQAKKDASKKHRKKPDVIENPIPRLAKGIGKAQRKKGLKGTAANVAVATTAVVVAGSIVDGATDSRRVENAANTLWREGNVPGANWFRKQIIKGHKVISALKG